MVRSKRIRKDCKNKRKAKRGEGGTGERGEGGKVEREGGRELITVLEQSSLRIRNSTVYNQLIHLL